MTLHQSSATDTEYPSHQPRPLIHHRVVQRHAPAINHADLVGDLARCIACKIGGGIGNLEWLAQAFHEVQLMIFALAPLVASTPFTELMSLGLHITRQQHMLGRARSV